jgi:Domain of unknown function (DUF3786)
MGFGGDPGIFETTYRNYLAKIAEIDLAERADLLGFEMEGQAAVIHLFETPYRLTADGITGPQGDAPLFAIQVLLCQYILLAPEVPPVGGEEWVSFRDFPDAAPLVGAFRNNPERAIAKNFGGALDELENACRNLGGSESDETLSYDLVRRFDTLPKLPLLLLFNDADEEFGAECSVLFQRRAEKYLDMECLAIAGGVLGSYLNQTYRRTSPIS